MFHTKPIHVSDKELIPLLVSFLLKCKTFTHTRPSGRMWLKYTSAYADFLKNGPSIDMNTLPLKSMVSPNVQELYLVKDLGIGSTGKAVLLYSQTENACCVAKFIHGPRDRRSVVADAEIDAWHKAYGTDCGVRKAVLANKSVLLMPYIDILAESEFKDPHTCDLIVTHVKELAAKGIQHNDIARRHVGWNNTTGAKKICFIDWGCVIQSSSPLEASAIVEVVKNRLYIFDAHQVDIADNDLGMNGHGVDVNNESDVPVSATAEVSEVILRRSKRMKPSPE